MKLNTRASGFGCACDTHTHTHTCLLYTSIVFTLLLLFCAFSVEKLSSSQLAFSIVIRLHACTSVTPRT